MSKLEMLPELPSADAGAHIPRSPQPRKPRLRAQSLPWLERLCGEARRRGYISEDTASDIFDGWARVDEIKDICRAGILRELRGADLDSPRYVTWSVTDYGAALIANWAGVVKRGGFPPSAKRRRLAARDMGSRVAAQVADDASGIDTNYTSTPSKGHHP